MMNGSDHCDIHLLHQQLSQWVQAHTQHDTVALWELLQQLRLPGDELTRAQRTWTRKQQWLLQTAASDSNEHSLSQMASLALRAQALSFLEHAPPSNAKTTLQPILDSWQRQLERYWKDDIRHLNRYYSIGDNDIWDTLQYVLVATILHDSVVTRQHDDWLQQRASRYQQLLQAKEMATVLPMASEQDAILIATILDVPACRGVYSPLSNLALIRPDWWDDREHGYSPVIVHELVHSQQPRTYQARKGTPPGDAELVLREGTTEAYARLLQQTGEDWWQDQYFCEPPHGGYPSYVQTVRFLLRRMFREPSVHEYRRWCYHTNRLQWMQQHWPTLLSERELVTVVNDVHEEIAHGRTPRLSADFRCSRTATMTAECDTPMIV